jgi:hydrogenase-4 component E
MSGAIVLWLVVLALGVVIVRSRSIAVAIVAAQSSILAIVVTHEALADSSLALAAAALWLRVFAVTAVLGIGVIRTRELRPVPAGIEPISRAVIALVGVMLVGFVVPPLGVAPTEIERGTVALLVLGIVIAMTRRATVIQILGIVVAENAATTLALTSTHAVPVMIELGVVFDLLLVSVIATAFHSRIFGEFGSGDAHHLRGLRD